MKKIISLLSLTCAFAFACNTAPKQLNVEPVVITEEDEFLSVDISRNVFSSDDPEINESCVVFNGHVEEFVAVLREKNKEQTIERAAAAENPDSVARTYFTFREEVLRADSHYISLLVTTQTLIAGSDIVSESRAFNYDVRTRRMLAATDFIDFTKSGAIDEAILNHFANPDACFTGTPTLQAATAINFSTESVIFTYDPTVLGPAECGGLRIEIPKSEIRGAFLIRK